VHFVALVRRRRVSATKRTVWVHNVAPSAVGGVSATKCTARAPYPAAVDVRRARGLGVSMSAATAPTSASAAPRLSR
jgi:hypothetical protein